MKIFLATKSEDQNKALAYYPAVDFLRGLGALVILVWHYHHFYFEKAYFGPTNGSPIWEFSRQPFYDILFIPYHWGMWAVQFFWMLSGFVFAFVYLKRKVSAKQFFILRFSRLYPLHFTSLALIAGLQYVSLSTLGSFQILEINDLYHFILNLLYAQYWGFQDGYSFNSPSWSVSVEELVYWGFWLVVIKFNANSFSKVFLLGFLAFVLYPIFGIYAFAFFFFLGGVLVYKIHSTLTFGGNILAALSACLLAAIIAAIIGFLPHAAAILDIPLLLKLHYGWLNLFFFFSFSIALFIFAAIDSKKMLSENLNSQCKVIGSLTYSTYMLHLPIQVLILMMCEYFNISRVIFDNEFVFLAYLVLMILIGRLAYIYLERPAQSFLRSMVDLKR